MLTLPAPVAAVLGACHLAVAGTLALYGAHWLAVFLIAAVSTAALFLKRAPMAEATDGEG